MMTEKIAFITFEIVIKLQLYSLGIENFLISTDQLYTNNIAFGIAKKFPYRKEIDKVILRLFDTGIIRKFENDELRKLKRNRQSNSENSRIKHVLSMTDLAGPFSILVIGFILSLVTFLMEYFTYKIYRYFS
ncbi:uncharacterized protein LOC111640464 [Centruroides sculpturatus]|uniref:uncharacterized protein LOC111640464 n=1 Tax=Centruroides sculpturatus TaxID=218467 RepID=UPI000C6D545F|nr:uncharacterized protein LOC111640464 [Centruroides sculpturatus]